MGFALIERQTLMDINCPNRAYNGQTITSNRTLSDEECKKVLKEKE